ncbi:MAG: hypothetical protein BJ554DRAFT_3295 [Olpidium bornovanus]|uniref:Uncharacterized protein n=1 Tax=Olpidium bornovanus TaxID=278681 RepID=A0A8H8DG13_9FUNG|nr:MAG: hypothetical protein BJ554DRAFT_3295 [Olpidium bornovanus]
MLSWTQNFVPSASPLSRENLAYTPKAPASLPSIAVYVDDLNIAGSHLDVYVLGVRATDLTSGDRILDQSTHYIQRFSLYEQITPPVIPWARPRIWKRFCTSRPFNGVATEVERRRHRELIGCLVPLVLCTRPGIATATSFLSAFHGRSFAGMPDRFEMYPPFSQTNRVFLIMLHCQPCNRACQSNYRRYTDSDFANRPD